MKIFLLDDETNARETVKAYLKRVPGLNPDIQEASSIEEARSIMNDFRPELALLDINLQDGTSFDLLSVLDPSTINFNIIFISAHDTYAIKAFKFNAIDYILKPINPLEFNEAIAKCLSSKPLDSHQLQSFNETMDQKKFDRLVLKDSQAIHFVEIDELVYCKSESNYTTFYLQDSSEIIISKTLAEYEELLRGTGFFRPHRSYLINLYQIKKYDKREGGSIRMKNDKDVPLSRGKKDIFMQLIDRL